MNIVIVGLWLILIQGLSTRKELEELIIGCQSEIIEWVILSETEVAFQHCQLHRQISTIKHLISTLRDKGENLTPQHLSLSSLLLKQQPNLAQALTCLVSRAQPQDNLYFQSSKPLKHAKRMLKIYPALGKDLLAPQANHTLSGQRIGRFLKALFQFYHLQVANPSGTLAQQFLRALTVRSDVFQHEDLAFCLSLDSSFSLSTNLQQIDINNIFIKISQIHKSLQYLTLSSKCNDDHRAKLIKNLHNGLKNINIFQIIYNQYEPFVQIATQKYTYSQIRLLASFYAGVLRDRQHYVNLSINSHQQL